MVQLIFGQNFSCVVRGLKIVSTPTLLRVEVNHVAKEVRPRRADCPQLRRQQLVDVRDWEGLSV